MAAEYEGSWTFDPSKTTNMKALLEKLEAPDKLKDMEMIHTLVTKKTGGDEWESNVVIEGKTVYTEKWQINKKRKTYTIIDTETESTPTLDGKTLVEEQTIQTPKGNIKKMTLRSYIEGNKMITDMECEGVVSQTVYIKDA